MRRIDEAQPKQAGRWSARPYAAGAMRAFALLLPIAVSVGFVYAAARVVHPPASSFGLYFAWWLGLSVAATSVLAAVGRICRRLLPLAALLKLALVAALDTHDSLTRDRTRHRRQAPDDQRVRDERYGETPSGSSFAA
jgi:hypothetical protein